MTPIKKLDTEWFETTCPLCGHTYLWHCEDLNQCTRCGADYGYLITDLDAYFQRVRGRIKRECGL
jgi:uncharacterized protein (DUF983 family)